MRAQCIWCHRYWKATAIDVVAYSTNSSAVITLNGAFHHSILGSQLSCCETKIQRQLFGNHSVDTFEITSCIRFSSCFINDFSHRKKWKATHLCPTIDPLYLRSTYILSFIDYYCRLIDIMLLWKLCWCAQSGTMLGMGSANGKRRYNVTSAPIGCAHRENDPSATLGI